jgi:ribosomal protein S27AE
MAKAKSPPRRTTSGNVRASPPEQTVAPEEHRHMIEEAAYYRAQQRGFRGGDPVEDWLAAEREINRMLPNPQQQRQELLAYEKLRASVQKLLADAKDTLDADTIRQALDAARGQLKQLGEYTADTVEKAVTSVEKEMLGATRRMGARLENFSERSADIFYVWRDRGGQFLARAATAISGWVQQAGERVGQQTYHSGEIAASGTLECTACGERVVLASPAHLPACSKCRNTEFRRV